MSTYLAAIIARHRRGRAPLRPQRPARFDAGPGLRPSEDSEGLMERESGEFLPAGEPAELSGGREVAAPPPPMPEVRDLRGAEPRPDAGALEHGERRTQPPPPARAPLDEAPPVRARSAGMERGAAALPEGARGPVPPEAVSRTAPAQAAGPSPDRPAPRGMRGPEDSSDSRSPTRPAVRPEPPIISRDSLGRGSRRRGESGTAHEVESAGRLLRLETVSRSVDLPESPPAARPPARAGAPATEPAGIRPVTPHIQSGAGQQPYPHPASPEADAMGRTASGGDRPGAVPSRDSTASQPSSEPVTVEVSIGRIEVRGTPPPASQRVERRPSPGLMTLDEYLRRRSRGGMP
jgi:hypothetical protein